MFKPTFTVGSYKPNGTAKIKGQSFKDDEIYIVRGRIEEGAIYIKFYKEEYILSLNLPIAFTLSESWQISEGRNVSIKIKGRNLNLMIRTFYGV